QLALDLLAWMPMLALTGPARTWEPRRLRLRLLHTAGRLITTGRRRILRLPAHWPWTSIITDALARPAPLPYPGRPAPTHPDTPRKETTRARGTPPTRSDIRATSLTTTRKHRPSQAATRPTRRCERSRLVRQSEIVILSWSAESGAVVEPAGAGLVAS